MRGFIIYVLAFKSYIYQNDGSSRTYNSKQCQPKTASYLVWDVRRV